MKLSRFLTTGAVLQQGKPIHIWGWAFPGSKVQAVLEPDSSREAIKAGNSMKPGNAFNDIKAGCCQDETGKSKRVKSGEELPRESRNGETIADAKGTFSVYLDPLPAGGPYRLRVCEENGSTVTAEDILIGAVWFVSGQSNIDVDMARCYDSYPEIVRGCTDDGLRSFRIMENASYHGPIEEPLTGEWRKAERNTILQFSATGYFYAKALRELTGIPVGILQASLGGSRITSWMSRKMLEGDAAYQPLMEEMDRYADDDFMKEVIRHNEMDPAAWRVALNQSDEGRSTGLRQDKEALRETGWQNEPARIEESGSRIELPAYFRDTELADFTGVVWLTRSFEVPAEMAGKSAGLWLGTMVDSDITYVNGRKVGETGYQYPPRKYRIPEGVLRAGKNNITIRLVVENGKGRLTPGKGYFIYNDQGVIDLKGTWSYRIGASCEPVPPTDFINWKASGLFNGTAYPCFRFPVEGMVWYQGEANTHQPYDYEDLLKRYVKGYRTLWNEPELPFYYAQLPNYDVSMDGDMSWAPLREKQRLAAQSIPHAGMAVTMDLGEDNDLHPHGKEQIGRRLALLAAADVYDMDLECTGPVPERAELCEEEETKAPGSDPAKASGGLPNVCVKVALSHAEGIYADSFDKGNVILDAELVAEDGTVYPAKAELVPVPPMEQASDQKSEQEHSADTSENGEKAMAWLVVHAEDFPGRPAKVRCGYHSILKGALIYNKAGLPMSPFELDVM